MNLAPFNIFIVQLGPFGISTKIYVVTHANAKYLE